MSKNQLQRVTFAQAEKLQAAGFDWPTNAFYGQSDEVFTLADNYQDWNSKKWEFDARTSAPTVALALEWVRDVKGIHCGVSVITYYSRPDKTSFITYSGEYFWQGIKYSHLQEESTHAKASSVLLDELLTRLENER